MQYDASEFVNSLFNRLKDALVGTPYADRLLQMFEIQMFDEKTATSSTGEKKQVLKDTSAETILRVTIDGQTNLVGALDQEFRGSEVEFRWDGDTERYIGGV
jgi:hypothetical protein